MKIVISNTFLAVLAVDLLATTGDTTMTWSSPILPKLHLNNSENPIGRPITDDEDTWIGSLINIGAMIGPFIFGYMAEKIGRKKALLSIAVPHFISFLTFAFAKNVYLFYFGRILGGLAVGGGYTLMPMYIAEIAETKSRGKMSVTLLVFWTFGDLLSYIIGPYVSIMWFNLFLSCLPVIFFTIFFFTAPETPYHLVQVNKVEEAEKTLMLLRSKKKEEVEEELEEIKLTIKSAEHGHFSDIVKTKANRKALLISVLLIIFQQVSGSNAILFNLQTIFKASGTTLPSDISSIIVGVALFTSSFTTPFLADRLGRKLLLIYSCLGMIVALTSMGTFFYLQQETSIDTDSLFWLPVLSLVLFIFFFNFGLSSIPWTLASELFPSSVKSAAASICSSACWISSFFITKFFYDLNSAIDESGTFWMFGGCMLLALLFCIFYVPETKGKTFLEIQDLLLK